MSGTKRSSAPLIATIAVAVVAVAALVLTRGGEPGSTAPPSAGEAASATTADGFDPGNASKATLAEREAIEALGKKALHSAAAEARLIAALSHGDQDVRGHASWGLGRMAPKTAGAIPALINALGDPIWSVQHNAAWALLKFEKVAVKPLLVATRDKEPRRAVRACAALLDLGYEPQLEIDARINALYGELKSADQTVAILSMGALKQPSAATLALLRAKVRSADEPLRLAAIAALGRQGPAAASALPDLIAALGAEKKRERMVVAIALGDVGVASKGVVAALVQAMGDAKDRPAQAAAGALSKLGAVDALVAALEHPSKRVRQYAAEALGLAKELDDARAKGLAGALGDADWQVRFAALGKFQGRKEAAALAQVEAIGRLLVDPEQPLRELAAAVLRMAGTPRALKLLAAHPVGGTAARRAQAGKAGR